MLMASNAMIIRNGKKSVVNSRFLVPGDLVF